MGTLARRGRKERQEGKAGRKGRREGINSSIASLTMFLALILTICLIQRAEAKIYLVNTTDTDTDNNIQTDPGTNNNIQTETGTDNKIQTDTDAGNDMQAEQE